MRGMATAGRSSGTQVAPPANQPNVQLSSPTRLSPDVLVPFRMLYCTLYGYFL